MRLALLEVSSAHVRLQDAQQSVARLHKAVAQALFLDELVQPYPLQECVRVLRGGGSRYAKPRILDREDKAQSVRVGVELAGLDQLDYHHLLAVAVLQGAPLGVGHPEVLQRGLRARVARLAGHDPLVDLRGELLGSVRRLALDVAPLVFHQLVQPLAPGLLVRRVDQHAVDVEDSATKTHILSFSLHARTGRGSLWLLLLKFSSSRLYPPAHHGGERPGSLPPPLGGQNPRPPEPPAGEGGGAGAKHPPP